VIDTSAIVAIIKRETGFEAIRAAIGAADRAVMSTGNLLELHLVTTSYRTITDLPKLLFVLRVVSEPVTAAHLEAATAAHDRYGRGSGHPAKLNYGDCFAYGLAKASRLPLLFKGNDFAQTDIEAVPY